METALIEARRAIDDIRVVAASLRRGPYFFGKEWSAQLEGAADAVRALLALAQGEEP